MHKETFLLYFKRTYLGRQNSIMPYLFIDANQNHNVRGECAMYMATNNVKNASELPTQQKLIWKETNPKEEVSV